MTYHTDYPKEPIGGGNPYYQCAYCGISDPQINGEIENHADWCEYRKQMEAAMRSQQPRDVHHPLTDEMCHELSCWPLEELDELYVEGTMTDMRAAYDLAIEHVVKLWRDIAETADNDFQLVIRFHSYLYDMRSQQQEDS